MGEGIEAIRTINGLDDKIGKSINNIEEVIDNINQISTKSLFSLFAVNLGLIILIVILLVIIYMLKCGHFFLCCSWSLLYLSMLGCVFFGAFFLVLGLFLQNLSYGISKTIKEVRDLDENNKVFKVIDVCFNGNGLLYQTLLPEDLNVTAVEKIYKVEKSINEEINEIKKYEITSTKIADEKYHDFKNNPKNI